MGNFVHDPGPLRLAGIRTADPHALTGWLLALSSSGRLLAADLSLGAWRNFQAAHEIFAQLGLREPVTGCVAGQRPGAADPAVAPPSKVGQRIDLETAGEVAPLDAFRLANDAVRALEAHEPVTLCVLAGFGGVAWEPADTWFVRFLAQALRQTEHRIVLVACGREDPELPPHWFVTWSDVATAANPTAAKPASAGDRDAWLTLVPGVVTADVASLLDPSTGAAEPLAAGRPAAETQEKLRPVPRESATGEVSREPLAAGQAAAGRLGKTSVVGAAGIGGREEVSREALIPLPGGCFLVPPALRRAVGAAGPEQYDRLAVVASGIPWLAAYARFWGADQSIDTPLLWEHARAVFEGGGFGIAIRLLERAIRGARTPAERAVFEILVQGARIRGGRFGDATGIAEPDERLAPELRGWLSFTRGWALTMLDKPAEAEPCLARARDLLDRNGVTDEYLYVLNISALNRLKLGDWDAALSTEQRIRSTLERITCGRWQIAYVNSLNLARLYRRRGDLDAAERYYREAFSSSFGAWSDSDAIYFNVCLAKLHEARRQYSDAMRAWACAALLWVSCNVPEGVGGRVTGAIAGSRGEGLAGNLSDRVSDALATQLLADAKAAGYTLDPAGASEAPAFVNPDAIPPETLDSTLWQALRIADCWVFGTTVKAAPISESEANRRLRALLGRLVRPAAAGSGEAARTILVDSRLGRSLPQSEAEMLGVCLRLGLRAITFEGKPLDLEETRLVSCLRVRLGSAVSEVAHRSDSAVVAFKRYMAPRTLSGASADVVRVIAEAPRAVLPEFDLPLLRALEQEHIVELFLPGNISIAAVAEEVS